MTFDHASNSCSAFTCSAALFAPSSSEAIITRRAAARSLASACASVPSQPFASTPCSRLSVRSSLPMRSRIAIISSTGRLTMRCHFPADEPAAPAETASAECRRRRALLGCSRPAADDCDLRLSAMPAPLPRLPRLCFDGSASSRLAETSAGGGRLRFVIGSCWRSELIQKFSAARHGLSTSSSGERCAPKLPRRALGSVGTPRAKPNEFRRCRSRAASPLAPCGCGGVCGAGTCASAAAIISCSCASCSSSSRRFARSASSSCNADSLSSRSWPDRVRKAITRGLFSPALLDRDGGTVLGDAVGEVGGGGTACVMPASPLSDPLSEPGTSAGARGERASCGPGGEN